MPIFDKDTNGTNNKNKYIMGRRNWCSIVYDDPSGDFIFDIRVEREKGVGETVGCVLYLQSLSRTAIARGDRRTYNVDANDTFLS